ncbi:polymer-forming cytoskeletal protein [Paenibacillus sp. LHD-38]|uniref:bactofilin family protein n=1 Tax=Paenibacillus sp. LHD-38 TaxID=3072143 RepID=UPI00280DA48B|nr:polymer-forming cytoskeletal protein [Paenibacillus sp. LHD-38]MDQ8733030.1 polymer-forming cytoskeletal protein [Paenibacillus sp. LHD-38]
MFKDNKRLAAADTLIGQGTLSEGKMICETSLRIEGEHRGDIECNADVIIGECGLARSNIMARDIIIAGKVFGDIITKGRLTITASGMLTGAVTAHSLIIHDGGSLNGSCQMESSSDSKNRSLIENDTSKPHGKELTGKESKEKSRQAG